jgi:uridine kinase
VRIYGVRPLTSDEFNPDIIVIRVMGPTGAGKSTVCFTLNNFLFPMLMDVLV